ncbi:MAG: ABC transporter permease subunit [Anaerolineaceae bacterium]|nr:ABC transporter permease subunit [Anaerolineaceae bacterium]
MVRALKKHQPPVIFPRFQGVKMRVVREHIAAYLFLFPAAALLFVFNVFPVLFSLFVSLHEWSIFPEIYNGLENYEKALGDFAFVLFFWLAFGLFWLSYRIFRNFLRSAQSWPDRFHSLLPASLFSLATTSLCYWFLLSLPLVVDSPRRLPPGRHSAAVFIHEFLHSFRFPEVVRAGNIALILTFIAIAANLYWWRKRYRQVSRHFGQAVLFLWTFAAALWLIWMTYHELVAAVGRATSRLPIWGALLTMAQTFAELRLPLPATPPIYELPIWSQLIFISAGAMLVFAAYRLWQRAHRSLDDRAFYGQILAAILFLLGGYLLIVRMPVALQEADDDLLRGFGITAMFSLGTVPVQLSVGLVLAYLLFQNIRGKEFFRLVYFLPYIMPFAATAVVFKVLFGQAQNSTLNNLMKFLGLGAQKWLQEPTGIFQLLFGSGVPEILAGPSLALVVIMIYTSWTYIGFDTVVFLAGLGNIPSELYEAARIDGASGWRIFRHITLPLLSPTTFFLSLIAIIGTFQAFTQLWIMRTPASSRAVDTASIYMFETIRNTRPQYGYGAAMAFVLFIIILLLTLAQNQLAGRRVFYG